MNEVKQYVLDFQKEWEVTKAAIEEEIAKQLRKTNRASEVRLRGLVRGVHNIYKSYRDASLADAEKDKPAEATTTAAPAAHAPHHAHAAKV